MKIISKSRTFWEFPQTDTFSQSWKVVAEVDGVQYAGESDTSEGMAVDGLVGFIGQTIEKKHNSMEKIEYKAYINPRVNKLEILAYTKINGTHYSALGDTHEEARQNLLYIMKEQETLAPETFVTISEEDYRPKLKRWTEKAKQILFLAFLYTMTFGLVLLLVKIAQKLVDAE